MSRIQATRQALKKPSRKNRTCLDCCYTFSTSSLVTPHSVLPAQCGALVPQTALFCCLHIPHKYIYTASLLMIQSHIYSVIQQQIYTLHKIGGGGGGGGGEAIYSIPHHSIPYTHTLYLIHKLVSLNTYLSSMLMIRATSYS